MTSAQNLFLTQNVFSGTNPAIKPSSENSAGSSLSGVGGSQFGFLSLLVQQLNEGQDISALEGSYNAALTSPEITLGTSEEIDLEALDLEALEESLDGIENALFESFDATNIGITDEASIDFKLKVRNFLATLIDIAQTQQELANAGDLSAQQPILADALGELLSTDSDGGADFDALSGILPQSPILNINSGVTGKTANDDSVSVLPTLPLSQNTLATLLINGGENSVDASLENIQQINGVVGVDLYTPIQGNILSQAQFSDTQNYAAGFVLGNGTQNLITFKDAGNVPGKVNGLPIFGEGLSRHQLLNIINQDISTTAQPISLTSETPANAFGTQLAALNTGTALSSNNVFFDASQNVIDVTDLAEYLTNLKATPDQTVLQNALSPVTATKSASQPHPAIEQLAVQIRKAAASGDHSRFTVRLDPPELGLVRVDLQFGRNKSATARVLVERVETLHMLQRDAHALQSALEDAGLTADADSFTFDLAQQDSSADGKGFGEDRDNGFMKDAHGRLADEQDMEIIETELTRFIDPETGLSRINLVV